MNLIKVAKEEEEAFVFSSSLLFYSCFNLDQSCFWSLILWESLMLWLHVKFHAKNNQKYFTLNTFLARKFKLLFIYNLFLLDKKEYFRRENSNRKKYSLVKRNILGAKIQIFKLHFFGVVRKGCENSLDQQKISWLLENWIFLTFGLLPEPFWKRWSELNHVWNRPTS